MLCYSLKENEKHFFLEKKKGISCLTQHLKSYIIYLTLIKLIFIHLCLLTKSEINEI